MRGSRGDRGGMEKDADGENDEERKRLSYQKQVMEKSRCFFPGGLLTAAHHSDSLTIQPPVDGTKRRECSAALAQHR
ncbi:hypothetical protein MHYP_G00317690 [Metynnis hypsauchen]